MEQQARAGLQLAALAILLAACDGGPDNESSTIQPNIPDEGAEGADDTEVADDAGEGGEERGQPLRPIDYEVEFDVEDNQGYSFEGELHFWASDPKARIEDSAPGYARFVVDTGAEVRARNTTEGRNSDFVPPVVDVWVGPDKAIRDCRPSEQADFFGEPLELPDEFCRRLLRIETANTTTLGGPKPDWKWANVGAGEEIRRSADSGLTTVLEGCEAVVDSYVDAVEEGDIVGFILSFPEAVQGDWEGGESLTYDADGILLGAHEVSPYHWLRQPQRALEDRGVIEC